MRDRVCSKWKKGECNKVTTRSGFAPARACTHRHSFTPGTKESFDDCQTIQCALGSENTACPWGSEECPYYHEPLLPSGGVPLLGEPTGEPAAAPAALPAAPSGDQAAAPASAEPPAASPDAPEGTSAAEPAPAEPAPEGTLAAESTPAGEDALAHLHAAAR
jgi:hypothetical protein